MKNLKHFTIAAALLLSIGAVAQPPEPHKDPPPVVEVPEEVTPEQVIYAFVDAVFVQFNLEVAARLVEGGQTGDALKPVAAEIQKERAGWTLEVHNTDVQTKGDTASAKLMLTLHHRLFGKILHQERLTLHKVRNEWKIVPLSPEDFYHSFRISYDSDILANIATYLARPQEIHEASAFSCVTNLKQIGLGTMQFLQDWDEKFALKADKYQEALMPYIRNEQIFHCPDDKSGALSYSFNAKLENLTQAQITVPSQIVMIYEGKNGQLEFRHNNRAGIAFADGHYKLVTPEEAKTLKWKP